MGMASQCTVRELALHPTATDDALVRRCQKGEREPFRLLVERYGDVVFGTAVLMTLDRPLAEDLAQEAFLHAWRGIRTFRPGSSFRPWLLRILVNRVMSHRRRRLFDLVPLPCGGRAPAANPGPDAVAEQNEEHAAVRSAIARLPGEQRRVLVLRYYSELTVPGIARATGLAQGTVKSRLHRALARLREMLEVEGLAGERGAEP